MNECSDNSDEQNCGNLLIQRHLVCKTYSINGSFRIRMVNSNVMKNLSLTLFVQGVLQISLHAPMANVFHCQQDVTI